MVPTRPVKRFWGASPEVKSTQSAVYSWRSVGKVFWLRPYEQIGDHVLSREKLEVSVRVLARVLRAVVQGEREACRESTGRQDGGDRRATVA